MPDVDQAPARLPRIACLGHMTHVAQHHGQVMLAHLVPGELPELVLEVAFLVAFMNSFYLPPLGLGVCDCGSKCYRGSFPSRHQTQRQRVETLQWSDNASVALCRPGREEAAAKPT